MANDDPGSSPGKLGTSMVLAGGAAGLGFVDPGVGVVAAGAVPVVQAGVERVLDRIASWRTGRAATVLSEAAKWVQVDADELLRRIEDDPALEQLLVRTLQAAADAPLREKLVLYAVSLAAGTISKDAANVQWETTFVRALEDLDPAHIELLSLFTKTSQELGLGDGPEFDSVPESLNAIQLEMVAGHLPNRTSLLATLERHGLVNSYTATGGLSFSVGRSSVSFELTDFGLAFHERLEAVGQYLNKS